jgi:hypothetical protein
MSSITFAPFPIPVVTPLGSGYIVYIVHAPVWENCETCVALDADGQWRHFTTADIKAYKNATYGINPGHSKEEILEYYLKDRHPVCRETLKPEKTEWTSLLVAEFFGYATEKVKVHGVKHLPDILQEFQEKHNIK